MTCRVHIAQVPPGAASGELGALAVARALEIPLEGAKVLLRSPRVLPRDFDRGGAESLVQALHRAGIRAEVVALSSSGHSRCAAHRTLSPDGACERCRTPICVICILTLGERCPDCHRAKVRKRRFKRVRVAILLGALLATAGWAVKIKRQQAARTQWNRPLEVAVVLLSNEGVPPSTASAWARGLPALEQWLASEFSRVRDRQDPVLALTNPVRLRLFGPVRASRLPPFQPEQGGWVDRARHQWQLRRSLKSIDGQAELPDKNFDARLYVILEPSRPGSPGLVEGIAEAGGTIGMVRARRDETDLALGLTAVAHEFFHCLGATDKYEPSGRARFPEGFTQPRRDPVYPQEFAEVMVGEVPLSPLRGRAPRSLQEVRVGEMTAQEIGWIRRTGLTP